MAAPPPRLAVLAARDADVAVVLRRGPTDWVRLSLWDTAGDTVEHGGWMHARVPWRRCDLSPDGRLLVAFVADHGGAPDAPARDTWVALSRPPWWHALALWFNGTMWDFGGFFPDAASCTIATGPPDAGEVPPWFDATATVPEPLPGPGWTDVTVPHNRRLRDGWTEVEPGWWERPLSRPDGAAVAREHVDGVGQVSNEVALRWGDDLEWLAPDASLDVSADGRALVTREGRLEVHAGPGEVTVVDDVTDQRPDPRPAPPWARSWPGPPVS
jgi:hypothetical protein